MKKLLLSIVLLFTSYTVGLAVGTVDVTQPPYNAGQGGDDTTAIQNAVSASQSVYFPAGTYKLSAAIGLPDNQSRRLYGDGPGVSVLQFTTTVTYGFAQGNAGNSQIAIEGLSLQALGAGSGSAIRIHFNPTSNKFRTLLVHNVQIYGSGRDGVGTGFWKIGVYAQNAQNSVIDKMEIDGNTTYPSYPAGTQTGIFLDSTLGKATTGLHLTNLEIKYCDCAVFTQNWIEGLYLSDFEIVLCGTNGQPAIDLHSSRYVPNTTTVDTTFKAPAFHILNGHIDMLGNGIKLNHLDTVKISHLNLAHLEGANNLAVEDGNLIYFDGCSSASVTDCSLAGRHNPGSSTQPGSPANEKGIYLHNTAISHIQGNTFSSLYPTTTGSCIVIDGTSNDAWITQNLFTDVRQPPYADSAGSHIVDNNM